VAAPSSPQDLRQRCSVRIRSTSNNYFNVPRESLSSVLEFASATSSKIDEGSSGGSRPFSLRRNFCCAFLPITCPTLDFKNFRGNEHARLGSLCIALVPPFTLPHNPSTLSCARHQSKDGITNQIIMQKCTQEIKIILMYQMLDLLRKQFRELGCKIHQLVVVLLV